MKNKKTISMQEHLSTLNVPNKCKHSYIEQQQQQQRKNIQHRHIDTILAQMQ